MKKNTPLKKRQGYHGLLKKYHNVYLFIAILVGCGMLIGITVLNYVDVSDIKSLSSCLTITDSGVDKYDCSVSQSLSGIVFILLVFLLGTSLIRAPIISFIAFTKGIQIGFSRALSAYTYYLKGVAGIIMTLLPQVATGLIATFLISASAIQLSMYIIYSTMNRERLNFKQLSNSVLNDIFICFVIILAGSYLKSTLVIEFIELFNLIRSSAIIMETGRLQHEKLHV